LPGLVRLLAFALAAGALLADAGLLGTRAARVLGVVSGGAAVAVRAPLLRAALAAVALLAAGAHGLAADLEAGRRTLPRGSIETTLEARVELRDRDGADVRFDLGELSEPGPPARHLPGRVRLRVSAEELRPHPSLDEILPGDRLRLRVRLRAPTGRANPGGRDRARSLARAGIGAEGRLVHPALHVAIVEEGALRPLRPVHRLRGEVARRLVAAGEGGGLVAALAVGERADLPRQDREALARLGLSHLLSVSGLHLMLCAGLVFGLLRRPAARLVARCGRGDARRIAVLGALAAAAVYALLSGFGVPVRRSLVLVGALAAGVLRGRPAAAVQALWLAAALVLAFSPAALFDVGAQLSFAASAALLLGLRPSREPGPASWETPRGAARLRRAVADLLHTSALALAATAPLTALHLGRVASAGLVANLLAVPGTGLLILPASLLAALVMAVAPDAAPSAWLARLAAGLAAAGLAAARGAAAWLPAAPPGPPPGVAALLAWLPFGVAVLRTRWLPARIVFALLGLAPLTCFAPAALAPAPPRLVVLDVGQGDAVLVQGRQGSLLVDAGRAIPDGADAGRDHVVPALAALGVERLDAVAASHGDLDHRGGLPAVLEALPVGRLWLPRGAAGDRAFEALRSQAAARGVPIEERARSDPPAWLGDLRVETLWPPASPATEAPATETGSRNARSLVLRVSVAGSHVLLPGDLDREGEEALAAGGTELASQVLLVPHHGSRTSSSAAFLAALDAEVAVVSAPCNGRFGMPHPEVQDRLRDAGFPIWWTGRDGAVLVGLGARRWVRGFRGPASLAPGCGSGDAVAPPR
jgi:competence protein ComEC